MGSRFEASGWEMHDKGFFSTKTEAADVKSVNLVRQMAFDQATQTSGVRRIFSLFYAKIMVVGDGQFYRGFGGYWVFWLVRCISECHCEFGTVLALVE